MYKVFAICLLLAVLVGCESPESRCLDAFERYLRAQEMREDSLWGMVGEDSLQIWSIPLAELDVVLYRLSANAAGICTLGLYYTNGCNDFILGAGEGYLTWQMPDSIIYRKTVRTDMVEWNTKCPYTTSWGELRSRQ